MKNTTLLILLSLFITSCGEKIREEITERYDNGKMKTIMKFIGEGSEEVMIEKLVYSQSGDTLVLENYNSKGEKDGKWIGYIDDSFVKRNYKDGELDGKYTWYYENGQIRSEDKNMRTKKELEEIIRKIKSGEMEFVLRKWTDRFRKKLERWKEG